MNRVSFFFFVHSYVNVVNVDRRVGYRVAPRNVGAVGGCHQGPWLAAKANAGIEAAEERLSAIVSRRVFD